MKNLRLLSIAILAVTPAFSFSQQIASLDAPSSVSSSSSSTATLAVKPMPTPKEDGSLTGRWLDLKAFSHSERYRSEYNFGDGHLFENAQERSFIQGRVKLDTQDRYSIGFRGSTGHYFNWAYSDFAGKGESARIASGDLGKTFPNSPYAAEKALAQAVDPAGRALLSNPSTGWGFYFRELYFSASPAKALTVEFGSFGVERGVSTEATSFDDDGYIDGERITVRSPKHLYFDQVGFTSAFLGNVDTPSMFDRGAAFKQSNYRQVFAKKHLNERIDFSAEYNWLNQTNTLREAAIFKIPETKIVDSVRLEAYQRLNTVNLQGLDVAGGSGFAVTLQKAVTNRLSGDIGYADIDKDYSVYFADRFFHAVAFALNGDQYGLGKRPFIHGFYKVNSVVTAYGFYTHEVGAGINTLNKQGLNGGLNFDLKALANTGKRVF
jgi:hypothetical protein